MLLTADVPKAELVALVESLTPFRLALDQTRARSLTVGRPKVTFVPGRGVRLTGNARVSWEVAGLTVPVNLQGWQILLVPKVVTRPSTEGSSVQVLALEPVIEELGLRRVPAFVDDKIAETLRDWIGRKERRLAWSFARTLSRRLSLPARITPSETFEIRATGGEVEVTAEALRFSVRFTAHIERGGRPVKRSPGAADQRDSHADRPGRHPASPRGSS